MIVLYEISHSAAEKLHNLLHIRSNRTLEGAGLSAAPAVEGLGHGVDTALAGTVGGPVRNGPVGGVGTDEN